MKKLFLVLSVLLATFSGYTSGAAGYRIMPVNSDANGTAVFKAGYDARSKQTVIAGTFRFHRGFTGHEHLPEFALINMNGRMYDPILGRFLSPDPYVQAPEFSQNFNRYSYCVNNPLIYTDQLYPNGYTIVKGVVTPSININTYWYPIDIGAYVFPGEVLPFVKPIIP
jgi:RHS repeat-associated protein